jgi:hypothetical protein
MIISAELTKRAWGGEGVSKRYTIRWAESEYATMDASFIWTSSVLYTQSDMIYRGTPDHPHDAKNGTVTGKGITILGRRFRQNANAGDLAPPWRKIDNLFDRAEVGTVPNLKPRHVTEQEKTP